MEKLLKRIDKNSRQKDQTEKLKALNTEDGTLWRKAKIMQRRKRSSKNLQKISPPPLTNNQIDNIKCIQPSANRPIWLLRIFSKLTENFILEKSNEHLVGNKILCPEQFGFRKTLTTTHQLLRVVEYITSGFEKGECAGAVFLDVQKAFDRVWIQGLIHKLIRYKTPPQLLQLLKSYLEERKFAVKIGNSISEAKMMRAGIPQGGKKNLQILYSLYVNDIPKMHKTLLDRYPLPYFPQKLQKILKSSSKRHITSLSEQLTVKYHIQRSEFSAQQQLLFTGTSFCSAPATIPQDPDGLPPTRPLPPTTAADHLISRTEMIRHHQRTITGD
ncbi:putative RNA-directed DNA polymerase from transposon BS [Araneus ventricosus]|uniref:Putative RNA-directed DNA polymerase from transposon BS n=1 Tax=Araneus ventricosus TaxID=182803 RepID=A0A4Y2FNU6_ARAVE|nr:putative RNA-directed DNA polymerase from transposon BS [Araneus ventricosus]